MSLLLFLKSVLDFGITHKKLAVSLLESPPHNALILLTKWFPELCREVSLQIQGMISPACSPNVRPNQLGTSHGSGAHFPNKTHFEGGKKVGLPSWISQDCLP